MVKFMELKSSLFVILLKLYVTTNYIICNVYDYEWYITEHGKLGLSKYKLKNIMTKIYLCLQFLDDSYSFQVTAF